MKPAIISGSFADFKLIKSRKVAQFVVEVALERADEALASLGGLPNPATETPVVIARLNPASSNGRTPAFEAENAGSTPAAGTRDRRRFSELPPAQQAALKCSDEAFRRFMKETGHAASMAMDDVVEAVREFCGVRSRADLNTNPAATERWRTLLREFNVWMQAVDA